LPRMKHIWADGGYAGRLVDWAKDKLDWTVDIVPQGDATRSKNYPRQSDSLCYRDAGSSRELLPGLALIGF
jgi:hypothetical protein